MTTELDGPRRSRDHREPGRQTRIAGIDFDVLTEREVLDHIIAALASGRGGWVITPNVDICRKTRRDASARNLVGHASLVLADGMPVIWAARLRGEPLPERVTGSSLIISLSAAAADHARSVYLLGGEPGVPEQAATELSRRFAGLRIAGADAPPPGFDHGPAELDAVRARLVEAKPDIVFVGLGFPKQERVIAALVADLPTAWFVGCGAAIPLAAGVVPRAPGWMQRAGLEWLFRLLREPRRLFRRYLVDDLPFALRLLAGAAAARLLPRSQRKA